MKASEYIKQLTQLIEEHGDKDVYVLGSYLFEEAHGPRYVSDGDKRREYAFLHEPDDYIYLH